MICDWIKKPFIDKWAFIIGVIALSASITVWAFDQDAKVIQECQIRIDRACNSAEDRFAKKEDVMYNSRVLEEIDTKINKILNSLDKMRLKGEEDSI